MDSNNKEFDLSLIKNQNELAIKIAKFFTIEELDDIEFEDGPDWTIEINSLEELIAFRKKYGELVLTASVLPEIDNEIEIYDDYREL